MIPHFFKSEDRDFTLLLGDCVELMRTFDFEFDMIFADPPYFLSNGGLTVSAGKIASVNKENGIVPAARKATKHSRANGFSKRGKN